MMKDFSEWLDELTGELQEPEDTRYPSEDASWIVFAKPEPCGVCGSDEEVCECEEAEYARHQQENTELWTAAAREFCKQVASSYGLTADIMAKQSRAADTEQSIKRLDEYRRGTWREEDENE